MPWQATLETELIELTAYWIYMASIWAKVWIHSPPSPNRPSTSWNSHDWQWTSRACTKAGKVQTSEVSEVFFPIEMCSSDPSCIKPTHIEITLHTYRTHCIHIDIIDIWFDRWWAPALLRGSWGSVSARHPMLRIIELSSACLWQLNIQIWSNKYQIWPKMSLAFFGIFLATCLWQILSLLLTLARGQMDHQMLFEVKLLDCCRLYHMFGVSALSLSRLSPNQIQLVCPCSRFVTG